MNELFDCNKHIDHLISIAESINTKEITLLTGLNASGKSLIRKMVRESLCKELGRKPKFIHASQELRTTSNRAFSSFAHDLEWLATSKNTIHILEQCLKHKDCDYLVLDEPEIGMGEELQLGLVEWLNEELSNRSHGVLIICHARLMVKSLKVDSFINIEGMTRNKWLNREVIPYNIEEFKVRSSMLFEAVRDRIKRN